MANKTTNKTGGCACGQVRYRLLADPMIVHCCHCTWCQRETGSAFAVNMIIEASAVELLPSKGNSKNSGGGDSGEEEEEEETSGSSTSISSSGKPNPLTLVATPSFSGEGQGISRCTTCWVAVWSVYNGAGPKALFVRAGTLDDTSDVRPDVHIFTGSKQGWVMIPEGEKAFEELYPGKEGVWTVEARERWKKVVNL